MKRGPHLPIVNKIDHAPKALVKAQVVAYTGWQARRFRSICEQPRVGNIRAYGLLDKHSTSVLQGRSREFGVQVVWCRDKNSIQRWVFQKSLEIIERGLWGPRMMFACKSGRSLQISSKHRPKAGLPRV
jgi:hypothetical protein